MACRAPLVDALVVGRRSGMDRQLKTSFASSGLVHLLSISGFHIGLIAAWVVLVLRQLGLSRVPSLTIAASLATTYVAFLGWPAPAVRAGAMAWVLVWLRWRQRAVQPDALLAATGLLVLLFDPFAVFDLGGWLSVLSLWGAVRFARWAEEAGGSHWLWQSAASSVGATVATAPVTAWLLGAVAPIGIALNFLAIPVAAVAVPGVLASLLLAPLAPVSEALAAGSGVTLQVLELIAEWGARVPLGHVVMNAVPGSAVPWLLLLVLLCWATPRRGTGALASGRLMLAGAALVWVALVPDLRMPLSGAGRLTLHFVDVGQGDAAVLRTPNGHFVVIDAGPRDEHFDAGASRVVPLLQREGADAIDVLVASHAHLDHVGGFGAVLRAMPVGTVVEPATPGADATYREMLGAVGLSGAAWDAARRGEEFIVDSVRFTVLHPDTVVGRLGARPERRFRGPASALRRLSRHLHGRCRRGAGGGPQGTGGARGPAQGGASWQPHVERGGMAPGAVAHRGGPVGWEPQSLWPPLARRAAAPRRATCYDLENRSGGHGHRHYRRPPRGSPRPVAPLCLRGDRVARQHQPGVASLMRTAVTTIERFIMDQERDFPDATGELSSLLYDIALATKLIAASIRRAGLVDVLGSAQNRNVQGEEQQKLDVLANEAIKESLKFTGRVCVMGSEEDEEMIPIPAQYRPGKYVVLFDPLDGSSNIDVNAAVGTIFSVYRRVSDHGRGTVADILQPGIKQVAAGYVMYGSSTMLVYTTGQGVHGFTLDPDHRRVPAVAPEHRDADAWASTTASTRATSRGGTRACRRRCAGFHGDLPEYIEGKNSRYIGSLVADFHRNLIAGGIFMYPADKKNPNGKLRLLYECAPMAFIAEQAGGAATDGEHRIMERVPASLHERSPLVIGSRDDVRFVADTIARVRDSALMAVGRPDRRS